MKPQIGTALKYGDNINTDIISPPQYMELSIAEACVYAMSAVDSTFASRVRPGDIFVAGNNLGSGSSRETSPLTLQHLGIRAVIARSFARIFYRNLINIGIPAIQCAQADNISDGDSLEINYHDGIIYNRTKEEHYRCGKLPDHILQIIEMGGLYEYLKSRLT